MWQIFIGSLLLGLVHPLVPNHWIPLIAISKTEKWTTRESVFATLITGFSHTISTIIIGIIVGFVGIKLSESYSYITRIAAPVVLLAIGLIYIGLDFRSKHHHHHFEIDKTRIKAKKSKTAVLISLCIGMFLSPCIEIEAYYFQAGSIGWMGIFIVSAVYLMVTILVMLLLVYLGYKGIRTFNLHFLDHHEKAITGLALITLGLLAYLVKF